MAGAGKSTVENKIKALGRFIWSQQGKCESISEINRQLINQYCRFVILSEVTSETLVTEKDPEQIEILVKNYEKFCKIALQLYKVLKFETIKDELASFGNPYTELFKEAEKDGDF